MKQNLALGIIVAFDVTLLLINVETVGYAMKNCHLNVETVGTGNRDSHSILAVTHKSGRKWHAREE